MQTGFSGGNVQGVVGNAIPETLHDIPRGRLRIVRIIRRRLDVDMHCKLASDLRQRPTRPVTEPINDTPIEQGRGSGSAVIKVSARRIHGEHDVQILLHIARKVPEEFVFRIKHDIVSSRPASAVCH